jgi:hypothetical protein
MARGLDMSAFEIMAKREVDKISDIIFLEFGYTSNEVTNAFQKFSLLEDSQTGGSSY